MNERYYWSVFCRTTQEHEAEGYADSADEAKAAAEAALTPDMLWATKRYTLEVSGPIGDEWSLTYGEPEGWVKS